jgi:hypothetical protein
LIDFEIWGPKLGEIGTLGFLGIKIFSPQGIEIHIFLNFPIISGIDMIYNIVVKIYIDIIDRRHHFGIGYGIVGQIPLVGVNWLGLLEFGY